MEVIKGFCVCIDTTIVTQRWKVSTGRKSIVGASIPHHFVSIEGQSEEKLKDLI